MKTGQRDITVKDVKSSKVFINKLLSYEQIKDGSIGNIEVKNIHDSTISIILNLQKSAEYSSYLKTLELLRKDLKQTANTNLQARLEVSKQITAQEKLITTFEEDVLRIAEQISRFEIQTDRLRKAVDYFAQGKIREADTILDTEAITKDLKQIRAKEEKALKEAAAARQGRKHIANEFIFKALIQETDYEEEKRFEMAIASYEASIDAYEYGDNLITYADFLYRNHQITKSKTFYYKSIPHLKKEKDHRKLVSAFSKLAIIEADEKKLKESAAAITKAIELITVHKKDPLLDFSDSYPDLLMGLTSLRYHLRSSETPSVNKKITESIAGIQKELLKLVDSFIQNVKPGATKDPLLTGKAIKALAYFYLHIGEYKKSISHYEKAIDFFKEVKGLDPRMKEDARLLLAESYSDAHQAYISSGNKEEGSYLNEALVIYKDLAKNNPARFLLYIGYYKRLSGRDAASTGDLKSAVKHYQDALEIYTKYAVIEEATFKYHVADIYLDLSTTYKKFAEYNKSIDALIRGIEIYQELYDAAPNQYMFRMVDLLQELISLYFTIEPAGLEWNDFLQASLSTIEGEYTVFNLYVVLLSISDVYSGNHKQHLVPGILDHIESSFTRQTKPNTHSVQKVIEALEYHGRLLEDSDPDDALAKYDLALSISENAGDNLSDDQIEYYLALITTSAGNYYYRISDYSTAAEYYQTPFTYYLKKFIADQTLENLKVLHSNAQDFWLSLLFAANYEKAINILLNQKQIIENFFSDYESASYVSLLVDLAGCSYYLGNKQNAYEYAGIALAIANKIKVSENDEAELALINDSIKKCTMILGMQHNSVE